MPSPISVIKKFIEVEGQAAEFIRNGPSAGLPGYVRDRYRDRCNQLANVPPWARLLGGPAFGSASRICRPYWDDQGVDGPVAIPPFTGGQCPTTYTVFASGLTASGQSVTQSSGGGLLGPIGGILRTPTGTPNAVTIGLSTAAGDNTTAFGVTTSDDNAESWAITQVTRDDGQADSCGDPPSLIEPGPNPPPDPGPLPGPEPTDDPRNPFGPPLFPVPPFIDPVVGPIPIVGDPEPTDPGGGGNPSGGDGLPGAPDAIGAEAGGASGGGDGEDVDFGAPPEGKIWVGALVEAIVDSRLGNIPGTGPAQTVYPTVIGNASLIYAGGRGSNTRLESSSTLLARQTTALVLTGCRVHAIPGVDLTVKAISAVTCPDNPCEEQDG